MPKAVLILTLSLLLAACAPRGGIQYAPQGTDATLQDVWVANFRPNLPPAAGQRSPPRPTELTFEKYAVSIPAGHQPGRIEWPDGRVQPDTDFVTVDRTTFPTIGQFSTDIARAERSAPEGTLLFVHGFNKRHGEAVYQMAQIAHDFEVPSPAVLFSWPSAGVGAGYIYDRDSVLIARDQLEEVIVALTRRPGQKIILMGHSMGNFLIMETLRQIEISGSLDIGTKIDALFMVSPDIDGELFQTQARRLRRLPDPSVIIAADQDRALRISAFLTGRTNRLGSQTDRSAVGDLPITVIDASDLSGAGLNHSIPLTSPAAMAILRNLRRNTLPGDADLPPLLDLGGLL